MLILNYFMRELTTKLPPLIGTMYYSAYSFVRNILKAALFQKIQR